MSTQKKQASKRLFKKLSALRATLSNDERDILDSLIVTDGKAGAKEVGAHKFNLKSTSGKASSGKATSGKAGAKEVEAHKFNLKATTGKATSGKATSGKSDPKEVEAHKFNLKATSGKATSGKAGAKEVEAHKLNMKSTAGKATSGKATSGKQTPRIEFDLDSEEYKIQE